MSWIPELKIGLWNAWIFMVLLLVPTTILPMLIVKEKMEKRMEGEPSWSELTRTAKIVFVITHMLVMPLALIYSIFLPLKLDTVWFFTGFPICLLALVMNVLFTISFITAPVEKPITNGIFAISRNPGYLSYFLMCVGIGIACASWIFLLFAVTWIFAWHFGVPGEEHNLIKKYGDSYREYMSRTPRWLGIPKSN